MNGLKNRGAYILSSSEPGYLTAFLNSKLFKFTFKDYFPELLGDTRELRKVFFENVAIKPYFNSEIFDKKVEIIEQKKMQCHSTIGVEQEIDELIFKHYNLTSSEILIIEESPSVSALSERLINSSSISVSV